MSLEKLCPSDEAALLAALLEAMDLDSLQDRIVTRVRDELYHDQTDALQKLQAQVRALQAQVRAPPPTTTLTDTLQELQAQVSELSAAPPPPLPTEPSETLQELQKQVRALQEQVHTLMAARSGMQSLRDEIARLRDDVKTALRPVPSSIPDVASTTFPDDAWQGLDNRLRALERFFTVEFQAVISMLASSSSLVSRHPLAEIRLSKDSASGHERLPTDDEHGTDVHERKTDSGDSTDHAQLEDPSATDFDFELEEPEDQSPSLQVEANADDDEDLSAAQAEANVDAHDEDLSAAQAQADSATKRAVLPKTITMVVPRHPFQLRPDRKFVSDDYATPTTAAAAGGGRPELEGGGEPRLTRPSLLQIYHRWCQDDDDRFAAYMHRLCEQHPGQRAWLQQVGRLIQRASPAATWVHHNDGSDEGSSCASLLEQVCALANLPSPAFADALHALSDRHPQRRDWITTLGRVARAPSSLFAIDDAA